MRSIPRIHTLQSIAVIFSLYFSQSLLLYPQLQLMTTTTAERSTYGTFSSTLLLHSKIKTPAINKPLRIIWHWLFYYFVSSSALLFFFIPSSLFTQALLSGPRNLAHSEKHSWKAFSPPDQGDFLIHSLLSGFSPLVCAHRSSLLLCMCVSGKNPCLEDRWNSWGPDQFIYLLN